MFDTIADMLRGSAPDDLAHALGTDRTQTRRAMEIGLPALITGLRDKTLEPGGAQNLASMLDEPSAAVPADLDAYLSAGDPSQGAAMLDVAFGDRGEPALAALSTASGLSTRLMAQVMSVLAPLATGTVATAAERSPDGLRSYLAGAVQDLEGKGFGRVIDLVSPGMPDVDVADLDTVDADMSTSGDVDDVSLASVGAEGGEDSVVRDADSADEAADAEPDPDLASPDLEGTVVANPDLANPDLASPDLAGPDLEGTVVEGAFPNVSDLDGDDTDLAIGLGGSTPDYGADVANVAPAGVSIAGSSADSPTIALAKPNAPDLDTGLGVDAGADQELELEGDGLSGKGWLWWVLGAIIGLGILLFLLSQCGGSDGTDADTDELSTTESTVVVEDPTPDAEQLQQQATLDSILVDYPDVAGRVDQGVAILDGTVETERDRAILDQAVRAAGLGAQNNVVATEVAAAPEGYSLNEIIAAQPELSTLRSLLEQAGLGEALDSGGGAFTLFAPTNDAFAAVGDQLAELQQDPQGALRDVLLYHLLVGQQSSEVLSGLSSVDTQLDGQSIDLTVNGGSLILNGSASVIAADAPGRNGIMHIINGVILPSVAGEFPEDIGAELGLAPIAFASGSSEITAAGQAELDKVVAFLLANPGNIEVGGHTDSDGDAGFNQTISQDRAEAVKAYLAAGGVPAESITATGFGATQPLVANDTAENKALNRRIEFRAN